MRDNIDNLIQHALEASIYVRHREPGLTAAEIRLIATRAGFEGGQIEDYLNDITRNTSGSRFLPTDPDIIWTADFPSLFKPDYRNPHAFEFVRQHLKNMAAERGRERALVARPALQALGAAQGLSVLDIDVAIELLMMNNVLRAEGDTVFHTKRNEILVMPLTPNHGPTSHQRPLLEAAYELVRFVLNPGRTDKGMAVRRQILRTIYDKYMDSPTTHVVCNRDESDPDSAIRVREAEWLHEHGLIVAKFGAVGDFTAKLTVRGRDFVDSGGFDVGSKSAPSVLDSTRDLLMQKPRIFIGSSVEGLPIAEHVQFGLDHHAECTLWSQGVFGLSGGTLDSLLRAVKDYEFAILVLTPDDLVHKRDVAKNSPRDNVLFELGLFMGALGRERTYIVYCRDERPELPTDLAGITAATFAKRSDGNLQAALGPVCLQIKNSISALKVNKASP